MPDLVWLADLGRASVPVLWLPVLAWTAVALVAEAALRGLRPDASLALPVRGAVLAALPLAVLVPTALSALAPEAAVFTALPDPMQWLPEVAVGVAPATVEAAAASGPSLFDVLLGLAVVTAAALTGVHALRLGAALAALRRTRRAMPEATPEARAAVDRACAQFRVTKPVAAVEAPAGVAPFTLGVRRPLVALPADLGGEARELAALHEVAHVRRADAGWHTAQRVVTALFGAHPLVWLLGRGLDIDRERTADATVLGARPDCRKAYADLLFSYAALPAPPLAVGAARGSSVLRSRIDAMTSPVSPTRTRRLARLGRLAGSLTLILTAGLAAVAAPSPLRTDLAFQLVDPQYEVDGEALPGGGSLSADPFGFYVFEADGLGRFIVGATLFPGSTPTGAFDGTTLRAEAGGHTLVIRSAAPVLRGEGAPTTAHVRFEAWPEGVRSVGGAVSEALPLTLAGLDPVGTPDPMGSLLALVAPAATVEGRVTDADTGAPIAQASVQVAGTTVGAATGLDGAYRLEAPAGDHVVRVAARGYETRTLRLADGQTRLDVALTASNVAAPTGPVGEGSLGAPPPDVFEVAEVQPVLIGGLAGLMERVVYPEEAKEAGIEGRVIVRFIVNESGEVEDAQASGSPNALLAEAAIRAVRASRFTPGRQRGEAVKVRFAVPITFRLPVDEE